MAVKVLITFVKTITERTNGSQLFQRNVDIKSYKKYTAPPKNPKTHPVPNTINSISHRRKSREIQNDRDRGRALIPIDPRQLQPCSWKLVSSSTNNFELHAVRLSGRNKRRTGSRKEKRVGSVGWLVGRRGIEKPRGTGGIRARRDRGGTRSSVQYLTG